MKKYLGSFANRESFVQAVKIGLVGVFNTVVSLGLFNIFLATGMFWFPSFTIAFVLTTFMSYLINRRWTFALKDGNVSGHETVKFFGINVAAYLASTLIVWATDSLFGPLDTLGYNAALIFAAGLLILPKLAGYRDVVFSRALKVEPVTENDRELSS
ncbi:MAG: GtrA family protein [Acidimicrobiia bacterium]|nr:GtrA family protein [Acidimicrobiia bacterium]